MRRLSRRLTVMTNEVIRVSDELKARHLSAPNQHHVVLLSISMWPSACNILVCNYQWIELTWNRDVVLLVLERVCERIPWTTYCWGSKNGVFNKKPGDHRIAGSELSFPAGVLWTQGSHPHPLFTPCARHCTSINTSSVITIAFTDCHWLKYPLFRTVAFEKKKHEC